MTGKSTTSRSSSSRGQTEPIAALVAIAVVILAVGVYGGYVTDALNQDTERNPAESVLDQVWDSAGSDGVYDESSDQLYDDDRVRTPSGYTVYIEVVVTDPDDPDGAVVDDALVHTDGTVETDVGEDERPDEVSTASRQISVDHSGTAPGDVDSGRLRVEVW